MQVIYADELFIENAVIDYILLIITAKLTAAPLKRPLAVLAAVFGGAYALCAALCAGVFASAVFKVAAGVLTAFIAFGGNGHFTRVLLVFFAVSAAFAGAVMAAVLISGGTVGSGILYGEVTFKVLALSFLVCYLVFSTVFRYSARHRVYGEVTPVTICVGDKSVTVPALIDTGNALVDPLSGARVTVCTRGAVEGLFDAETRDVLRGGSDPADALLRLRRAGCPVSFTLVPFKAVGAGSGMLLAFRPDRVRRGGRDCENCIIAISMDALGEGRGYSALTYAG